MTSDIVFAIFTDMARRETAPPVQQRDTLREVLSGFHTRMQQYASSPEAAVRHNEAVLDTVLNRVGVERLLENFSKKYSTTRIAIERIAGSGPAVEVLTKIFPDHLPPQNGKEDAITSVMFQIFPIVTEGNRSAGVGKAAIITIGGIILKDGFLGLALLHGIGNNPKDAAKSLTDVEFYGEAEGEEIPYPEIRKKIKTELKKFADKNNLVRTPQARRRLVRNGVRIVGATATAAATAAGLAAGLHIPFP